MAHKLLVTKYIHSFKMKGRYKRIIEENIDTCDMCRTQRNHTLQLHTALVMKRGKVLAKAQNSLGTRSRGCGYSNSSIHAERAVIKKVGNTNMLRGAVLYVWRVSQKHLLPSKPCSDCTLFLEKCMREYGLLAVYYTDALVPYA